MVKAMSHQGQRAFTLVEMLVVMAIVALLLTIATPRYFGALEKSKEAVLHENLRTVRSVLDKFLADKGRYPRTLNELVENGYLRATPIDPMTESSLTWITVESTRLDRPGISDIHSGAAGVSLAGVPYGQL
jgi:general secretion pathway protein G